MKADRKKAILEIISKYQVDTQETLQALLLERGFSVTQATVSRDINELRLVKKGGNYEYSVPGSSEKPDSTGSMRRLFADTVISVDRGMNTVVIRCHSGMAGAVCAKLDEADFQKIVGTLAGDDTIFVLMRTEEDAEAMVKELKTIM